MFESVAASRSPRGAGKCISEPRIDLASGASVCSWTSEQFDAGWVSVAGQVTDREAYDLEQALFAGLGEAPLVVMEPSALDFIGVAGLHAIINVSIRARYRGQRLALLPGPPNVQRVLALAGGAIEVYRIDPTATPDEIFRLLGACARDDAEKWPQRVAHA